MQIIYPLGTRLALESVGRYPGPDTFQIVWGHGWMHSHANLLPLTQSLEGWYSHLLVDFPGFGGSARPPAVWGSKEYADHIAAWLRTVPAKHRVWIGYSFGCRVGMQLARLYPDLVDGLFLIGAPGLPRARPLWQRLKINSKNYFYQGLKKLIPLGLREEWLRQKFGRRDFLEEGPLGPIYLTVAKEDFTEIAKEVSCPVHLLYGREDTATPPGMGRRYAQIMPNATLTLLPRYNHYNILVEGKHQIMHHLAEFIKKLA